jgi:hypothetical protein
MYALSTRYAPHTRNIGSYGDDIYHNLKEEVHHYEQERKGESERSRGRGRVAT